MIDANGSDTALQIRQNSKLWQPALLAYEVISTYAMRSALGKMHMTMRMSAQLMTASRRQHLTGESRRKGRALEFHASDLGTHSDVSEESAVAQYIASK